MAEFGLKKEYLDAIKKSPEIFKKVFGSEPGSLDTTVSYGLQLLTNNDPKLTQAAVLKILKEQFKVKHESELITELPLQEA